MTLTALTADTSAPSPSPAVPTAALPSTGVLDPRALPSVPGRVLAPEEIRAWVRELVARPDLWAHHARHDTGQRHYVSLYRDSDIDVWLLCWNTEDDTGWHDHDTSSGAVAVTQGAVHENSPRLGGEPSTRTAVAGEDFAFGPEHIHRMSGAVDGSVSIHAYSPPLWRMGQYSISDDGTMRRYSVSYADELRPIDG